MMSRVFGKEKKLIIERRRPAGGGFTVPHFIFTDGSSTFELTGGEFFEIIEDIKKNDYGLFKAIIGRRV